MYLLNFSGQSLEYIYEYDVKTDADGGIHFMGVGIPQVCLDTLSGCDDLSGNGMPDSLYNWYYASAGHYYLYNPDPLDQPENWTFWPFFKKKLPIFGEL